MFIPLNQNSLGIEEQLKDALTEYLKDVVLEETLNRPLPKWFDSSLDQRSELFITRGHITVNDIDGITITVSTSEFRLVMEIKKGVMIAYITNKPKEDEDEALQRELVMTDFEAEKIAQAKPETIASYFVSLFRLNSIEEARDGY